MKHSNQEETSKNLGVEIGHPKKANQSHSAVKKMPWIPGKISKTGNAKVERGDGSNWPKGKQGNKK